MMSPNLSDLRNPDVAPKSIADVDPLGFGRAAAHCQICGDLFWTEREYHEMGLCACCARKAGAAFLREHTGETHPDLDPDGYAREREIIASRYRKKPIPQGLRMRVFERDGFKCVQCGTQKELQADHIVAERNGGAAVIENLQTLCSRCNRTKGAR
jgi:hypothetical protein